MSSNGPIMKQLKGGFGAASKSFASPNYGQEEHKWPSTEIKKAAVPEPPKTCHIAETSGKKLYAA